MGHLRLYVTTHALVSFADLVRLYVPSSSGNSRRPEITQFNRVNIFLFQADSLEQILVWNDYINPTDRAGVVRAHVNDTWWGPNGARWSGGNISYPFYWVIIRADETLNGSELPQSIFTAVREWTACSMVIPIFLTLHLRSETTYADSVIASMSSTSVAAMSASMSAASASSVAAASASSLRSSTASIQPSPGGGSFPHWAIAVIVVLGFFALTAFFVFAFFLIRKFRRQNQSSSSNRNSMGSASPMMADMGNSPQSPLPTTAAAGPTAHPPPPAMHRAPSFVSPDGASTLSRAPSAEAGPFSGADAAIMADAFRKALRKPGFPDLPVEEDSPDSREHKEELLNRELAEEGRDIRNVGSSRGVRVETPS